MTATASPFVLKASKWKTNSFAPAQLTVFDTHVECRGKLSVSNQESQSIGFKQIAAVNVKTGFGGTSLTIETTGGATVTIDKVKASDAQQAKSLIDSRRFA